MILGIIGRQISDLERRLISLPLRYGGLGIQNPQETADREYYNSTKITEKLTEHIYNQALDLTDLDQEHAKTAKSAMRLAKENMFKLQANEIYNNLNESERRAFEAAREKGASAWLAALPLKSIGYALNKQEFRDSLCLRYGWKINGTPNFCACGSKNSVDHSLTCKLGGYTSMRHNSIRNTEAQIMREVCKDVQLEPMLQPMENIVFDNSGTNDAPNARLDIAVRGLWNSHERTFFDVRITHPGAPSNRDKPLDQLYRQHEREKKNLYNERIIQIEKGSFNPLVFTTSGGMSSECDRVNKKLAQMISEKRKEPYSSVINHIRTRLRFSLLRSTLAAVRGYRGKRSDNGGGDLTNVEFNIVPEMDCYET